MPPQQHTSKFKVEIDGTALSEAIDPTLVSAFVDDNLNLPDMFELRFRDPARTTLDDAGLKVGATVRISVFSQASPGGDELISGEVTALEAEFDPGGTMTVVRGLDHSHRLFRGRVTETYSDVTYSDVARKVATRAGLQLGKIDSAPTVHKHISQANVTDWQFLKALGSEIGYQVGCLDGKFEFRAPTESAEGPSEGNLASDQPLQLTLGANLLRVRSTVTSAEQVKEVRVRGWDMRRKKELVATAPALTRSATLGVTPAELADTFGSHAYIGVDRPYTTQAEVEAAAKALADQIAGAFAELEGVARGNAHLRAGRAVSLGLVNKPFDGQYTLTTTRHVYDPRDGYTVWFTVSGRQERSLLGLTSGASASNGSGMAPPIYGVVSALVTDVNDPEELGRVRLRFPWLSDSYTSDWARLMQLGAGPQRGTVILPEVNDEVVVAFEQGDVRRPYVLGGLYNGVDRPNLGARLVDGSTGAVTRRGFVSKKGHKLVFLDDDSKSGVMLATADDGLRIALKDTGTTIRVNSKGEVEIEAEGDVMIKAGGGLSMEATGNVTISAGGRMSLAASGGATLDGGAMAEVKGGVVKLN